MAPFCSFSLVLALLLHGAAAVSGELGPVYDLRVENVAVPAVGLTEPKPRLMWRYPVQEDRSAAVSYSVVVTTTAGDLVWASGEVAGAPASVVVGGKTTALKLQPFAAYHFNVTWRSNDGRVSPATSGSFDMGPMTRTDWAGAAFLGSSKDRRLKTTFTLPGPVVRARLFVDAPGCAVVRVNGVLVGTSTGICPWLKWSSTDLFFSHDVTAPLRAGRNELNFDLGSGTFYAKGHATPFLRALLVATDAAGKNTRIVTAGIPPPPPPPGPPGPTRLCTKTAEHVVAHLSCPHGQVISNFTALLFGTPSGQCLGGNSSGANSFAPVATCAAAATALAPAVAACVGRQACTLDAKCGGQYGHGMCGVMEGLAPFADPCHKERKHLAAAVACTPAPGPTTTPPPGPAPAAWMASDGAVVSDDPWAGCVTNWSAVDTWRPATARIADPLPPTTKRRSSTLPPTDVLATIAAVDAWKAGPFPSNFPKMVSTCIVKFPRNFVGYLRIDPAAVTVRGAGTIHAVHSEVLNLNYTARGDSIDFDYTWNNHDQHVWSAATVPSSPIEPSFVWHGFQFAMLGVEGDVSLQCDPKNFVGVNVGTALRSTGTAAFGDGSTAGAAGPGKFLNRLQQMVARSQQANVAAGMPTDCPTREKHGWLGDAQVTAEEAMYNFDMHAVYTEFLHTINDAQSPRGDFPGAVPGHSLAVGGQKGGRTDISWTAAFPLIANWLNKYYGDTRVAERHYASLKEYINTTISAAASRPDGLPDFWKWGDWCAVESRAKATPGTGPELAAFNFILAVDAMAELADSVGATGDATAYRNMGQKMRVSFQQLYYNASTHTYGRDPLEVQSLTVAPLALGAVPDVLRGSVLSGLQKNIEAYDYHFTVGSAGAKHLLPQLSAHGLGETAMKIATQTTYPSFGHWLELGATTCWENYHGYADPSHPPTPTHNHIFLCGGLGEWLYRSVAGAEPAGPGWSKVRFRPDLAPNGPSTGAATLTTVRGPVAVSWRRYVDGGLSINTTAAAGVSDCVLELPVGVHAGAELRESGQLVWSAKAGFVKGVPGIRSASLADKTLAVSTGPGRFAFGFSV